MNQMDACIDGSINRIRWVILKSEWNESVKNVERVGGTKRERNEQDKHDGTNTSRRNIEIKDESTSRSTMEEADILKGREEGKKAERRCLSTI